MSATDPLREATRAWLRFDNEVEPPLATAPYDEHVAYERAKADITEAVAEALAAVPAEPEESDHAKWGEVLADLDSRGLEANPIGTSAALAAVSKPCVECHGEGSHCDDSHPANLAEPCEPCGGHGVVPADARPVEPEAWEWRACYGGKSGTALDHRAAASLREAMALVAVRPVGWRCGWAERRRPGTAPGPWERVDSEPPLTNAWNRPGWTGEPRPQDGPPQDGER